MNERDFLQSVISAERKHENVEIITEEVSYNDTSYDERLDTFKENLSSNLKMTMSPHELVETVDDTALVSEFGDSTEVRLSPTFIKMKDVVTESILGNDEVKENTLALANKYLKKKIGADTETVN